ncbi:upstream activation factor subunit spp27-like [Dendronephthya gigantea]|uniref:upstream activation factor subunit spp27-like n=1 Tax=Dendronephthya gigantea TaxID=151771 RepID=UPI001069AC51|nr:upstream activation factor subunit spp27-like [Dendronephthya gigantea]
MVQSMACLARARGAGLQAGVRGTIIMADNLSETELRENIAEIIDNGDLATLTSKKIRQILEKKHNTTLSHRKKQIDDIVMQLVDEKSDNSDEESGSKSDAGKKEESSEKESKSPVKSERKRKVKDESDSDDMSYQSESESDSDEKKKPRKKKAARNKEKGKAAKKPKAEKGEGGKKKGGFSMPMLLSPELADLMGETHMARSEVVKKMWQIIKERDLLDPTNKRYTICDEQLEKIIGQKRFMTFAMMKYLKKHVIDPSQVQ